MQTDAEARLAQARAELLRDRETFERKVGSVFDQLTTERLELSKQLHQLITDRKHLVLVGRRLRRRWHKRLKAAELVLAKRESQANCHERRLALESNQIQKERAALDVVEGQLRAQKGQAAIQLRQLEAEITALTKQRTALIDFRICVEADCRRAEARRNSLQHEVNELENRLSLLRRQNAGSLNATHVELQTQSIANGKAQKVA